MIIIPGVQIMMEYCLTCSGGAERLRDHLFGIPMRLHRWFGIAILVVSWCVTLSTDWILAPPEFNSVTGWEHGYGPGFLPFVIGLTYVLGLLVFVLWRGVQTGQDAQERRVKSSWV